MKKIAFTLVLISPIFLMNSSVEPLSFGAPVESSGAPGETTCARSSCHDDNTINAGAAQLSVSVDNCPNNEFVPGQTYTVRVKIQDAGVVRFGFQLVVLNNADNTNAGSYTITDVTRTQILKNNIGFTDREYLTYTYDGTSAINTGMNEWVVDWTAPVTATGNITFYCAAISANNDNTDLYDHVYTKQLVLSPKTVGVSNITSASKVEVLKGVNAGEYILKSMAGSNQAQQIRLMDLNGKEFNAYTFERISETQNRLVLSTTLAQGLYLLQTINAAGEVTSTSKLIHNL